MADLAVNLLASVIAGFSVWLFQRTRRFRALARMRAFHGVHESRPCYVSIPRHASSARVASVHRRDVVAIVEVARTVHDSGGAVEIEMGVKNERGVGTDTEFCVGGPHSNERMKAHLEHFLPGLRMPDYDGDPALPFWLGATKFQRVPDHDEYAVVARVKLPEPRDAPLWLICGQTAACNQGAARYLREQYKPLLKRYGTDTSFCIVFRLTDPGTYGANQIAEAGDYSDAAFTPTGSSAAEHGERM